jgi:hypothetical protein
MGLEWARPGTGVFQPMLAPVLTFHVNGRFWRSAAPEAPGPRNAGQFCASAEKARRNNSPRNMPTSIIYDPQVWRAAGQDRARAWPQAACYTPVSYNDGKRYF